MRYLIIEKSAYGLEPFVIAETPEESWATDHQFLNNVVVLTEDEAAIDPEYAKIAAAWWARDDSTFENECAVSDAECQLDRATVEARNMGLIEAAEVSPEWENFDTFASRLITDPPATPIQSYYKAGMMVDGILEHARRDFGLEVAATVARLVALDVAQFGRDRRDDEVQS